MTTTATTTRRMPGLTGLIFSQIRYQLQLFLSTPGALVIGVGLPVALLVATGGKHSAKSALPILAGYAVFGLTMTAFNTHGVRLIIARESGVLRRWRASPLPPWCYFVSQIVTTSIFATFTGVATFVVGMLFYGAHVTAAGALAALVALLLGALAWSAVFNRFDGHHPDRPDRSARVHPDLLPGAGGLRRAGYGQQPAAVADHDCYLLACRAADQRGQPRRPAWPGRYAAARPGHRGTRGMGGGRSAGRCRPVPLGAASPDAAPRCPPGVMSWCVRSANFPGFSWAPDQG